MANNEAPRIDYPAVQQSPRFQHLRSTHRRFVFPVAIAAFIWFAIYVLLASYAREFMSIPVFGHINLGLLLGLSQFIVVFGVTTWYVSFANRKLDPVSAELRQELEAQEAAR